MGASHSYSFLSALCTPAIITTILTIIIFSDYQWTDDLVTVIVENFDQPVGAAVPIPDTVRRVFELIINRDFINHIVVEHIVVETNRYARTVMGEDRYRKWDKVEADDMYAYFGIMIMMGLVVAITL